MVSIGAKCTMYVFCLVLRFYTAQRICIICQTFACGRVWSRVSQYLRVDVGRSVHFTVELTWQFEANIDICKKIPDARESRGSLLATRSPMRLVRKLCDGGVLYCSNCVKIRKLLYFNINLLSQDTVNLLFFFLFFSPRRHAMRYNVCDNTCWRRTKKKKLWKSKRTFLLFFSFSFCVPVPTTENTGKILMLCIWWSWGVIKFLFALRLIHIYCKW